MRIHVYLAGAIVNLTASAAAAVIGFGHGRFPAFWKYVLFILALVVIGRLIERRTPKISRVFSVLEGGVLSLLSWAPILVICYAAQKSNFALCDNVYRRIDAEVGFDGVSVIIWVSKYSNLSYLMNFLYDLFLPSMLLTIAVGAYYGAAFSIAERTAISIMFAFLLSAGLSSVFPAYGYGVSLSPELIRSVAIGATPIAQLDALRDGSMRILNVGEAGGIITFPSMHWALAIILLCTTVRLRWLFLATLPVALGFMITALVQGAHYLADAFAGGIVGLVAVAATDRFLRLQFVDASEVWLSEFFSRVLASRIRMRPAPT